MRVPLPLTSSCLLLAILLNAHGLSASNVRQRPAEHSSWAERTLRALSLEEKVGQMLQVRAFADYEHFDTPEYQALRSELLRYHIGSVVFGLHVRGANFTKPSPKQFAQVTNQLQRDSRLPLLIGADLERGVSSRMDDVPIFPDQMAFGAVGDPNTAYQLGRITGQEARSVGINWAFAPVADVNTNPESPVINTRSFSDDPSTVAEFVAAFVRGAHSAGLLVTAKHFPGQGNAPSDSHRTIPNIGVDLTHLQSIELVPFQRAIEAGVDAVMVEHARVPALDLDPARVVTTSPKIIEGLLREQMGFKGLVVTDALEMPGLLDLYRGPDQNPTAKAAVDAVKAGNDIISIPKDLEAAFRAIVDAVRHGDISDSRIDASVLKILRAKESLGLDKRQLVAVERAESSINNSRDISFAQRIADRAMTLVLDNRKVLPLSESDRTQGPDHVVFVVFKYNLATGSGQKFQAALRERLPEAQVFFADANVAYELSPALLNAVKKAKKVVVAVFVSFNGVREELVDGKLATSFGVVGAAEKLLQEILATDPSKVAVVAVGSPYVIENFPAVQTYLCTYSPSTTSEISAVKTIFGEIQPEGKLPVLLPYIANRGTGMQWSVGGSAEQIAAH